MQLTNELIKTLSDDLKKQYDIIQAQENCWQAIERASWITNILRGTGGTSAPMMEHIPLDSSAVDKVLDYAQLTCDSLKHADMHWQYYIKHQDDLHRQVAKQFMSHAAAFLPRVTDTEKAAGYKARLLGLEKVIK